MRHSTQIPLVGAVIVPVLVVAGCADGTRRHDAVPANLSATRPAGVTAEMPAFGIRLPPPPAGFERVRVLGSGMFGGSIAAWQPVVPESPVDAKGDETQRERIYLTWRLLGMHYRKGITDHLREAAQNPGGSVAFSKDDFFRTAREAKVPRPTEWPTVRFERPDGTPDASDRIVRTEAVNVRGIGYVLIHAAPRGASRRARAAFDELAAGLRYAPPAPLGASLRVGESRRVVPGVAGVTIQLLEPFRGGHDFPSATAWDFSMFAPRAGDAGAEDPDVEDYIAYQYFAAGGADIPREWLGESDRIKRPRPGWRRDEPDLRIAVPMPNQKHEWTGFVGGRRLAGDADRWLWILILLPPRVIADAGGDDGVFAALEATLRTAEPTEPATTRPVP